MIERVTQQVWNWRWASNLRDTSNTEVTFPNSWKYHISSWSFAAFSSVGIISPYILNWVCFSLIKLQYCFSIKKSSWRRRVRRAIHYIPTQITWNPQAMKVLLLCSPVERGLIFNSEHFQICVVITPERSVQIRPQWISPLSGGGWTKGWVSRGRVWTNYVDSTVSVDHFVQNRSGKTKNVFRVDGYRKASLPLLCFWN